jgi:hypothetical protein
LAGVNSQYKITNLIPKIIYGSIIAFFLMSKNPTMLCSAMQNKGLSYP